MDRSEQTDGETNLYKTLAIRLQMGTALRDETYFASIRLKGTLNIITTLIPPNGSTESTILNAISKGEVLRRLDFASWRDNTTAVSHRCLMQLKSRIVGAGAGRRSRRSWTLAQSHTRTEVAEVPCVSMGEKRGSFRFARAPTKEDCSSSVYPSSSSF
jgi:hypothetical protein